MKSIAILLTVHNRKAQTIRCLEHFFNQQEVEDYQKAIYLINDGSTDGTSEAIAELYPSINIIEANGNLYWNRGMHLAWKLASKNNFDYYIWLNDDTFLFSNALNLLINSSEKMSNQSIIVGSTTSLNSNFITYGGRNINGELIIPNGKLQECHHFNGNIVIIPKYVFKINGNLDPIFHHAIGDFDYGLRALKNNIKSFVTSKVVGICEGHDNFSKWSQPERPLFERVNLLYSSSCDCNPKQFFIFENRHYNIIQAIIHFITIHIRVVFPKLWVSKKY